MRGCWHDKTKGLENHEQLTLVSLPLVPIHPATFSPTLIYASLPIILANGSTLSLSAASLVIKTKAAAPSLRVLALPAVTVPGQEVNSSNESCGILSKYFC